MGKLLLSYTFIIEFIGIDTWLMTCDISIIRDNNYGVDKIIIQGQAQVVRTGNTPNA